MDASVPPPIGEQPLEGDVVIYFRSVLRAGNVGVDARALAGGASAAFFEPSEGVYLAVFYTFKNETDSAVIPGTHVNNVFALVDSERRVWSPATYYSHGFEVAYALGVSDGKEDPRSWVDTGTSYDTALAFDLAEDASGLRLRPELLNLEIGLGE
jgi:hypothetical protein